jgi:hypothetical protein
MPKDKALKAKAASDKEMSISESAKAAKDK